jgi:predicted aspartyl protease
MNIPFDPARGAIVIGRLAGPTGIVALRLLVDTGANRTLLSPGSIAAAGYDPNQPIGSVNVKTASSAGVAGGLFRIDRLSALGVSRTHITVLSYSLPSNITFDGLLGLDFFLGRVLTFNFVNNTVELT